MPFSATAINQALDALDNFTGSPPTNIIAFASLHTAYSATGLNEVTGGSPAYARKAITWNGASSGAKLSSSSPTFDVPASTTVAYVGLWSASSGGTFAGMGPNGGATQFAFTAQASTDFLSAPGTAYTANQTVVMFAGAGAVLPSPLVAGTVYFVTNPAGATFQLAATSGGGVINLTTDGAGVIQLVVLESFGSQGTFTLNSDTLTIV